MDFPTMKITTPKGKARWPKLNEPDTAFKDEGEYSVQVILDGEAAAPLIEKLTELEEENVLFQKKENPKKKAKCKVIHHPYEAEVDENGDETGNFIFKFKMPAKVKRNSDGKVFEFAPTLFDKYGQPTEVAIGGGSIIQVGGQARGYFTEIAGAGVTLRLEAVVVHEARTNSKDATDYGFDLEAKPDGFDQFEEAQAEADGDEPESGGDF